MRILISVLAICFSCSALAETEADVVKSMSYNPNIKLVQRLAAFDGMLLGFDGGEWGGALIFLDKHGRAKHVCGENIKAIVKSGNRIFAFSGLAHLSDNEGRIIELTETESGSTAAQQLIALEGEPSGIRQIDEQSVMFEVFTGFREHKKTFLCKSFVDGAVSNANANACSLGLNE